MTRQHLRPIPPILHNQEEYFQVESLVNRRKRGNRYHYLVKYERYGPEHNQWIPELYIAESCRDLIVEYDARNPR